MIRKSDKIVVRYGEFSAIIDKHDCLVNPPLLDVWSQEKVEEYIIFLQKLLPHLGRKIPLPGELKPRNCPCATCDTNAQPAHPGTNCFEDCIAYQQWQKGIGTPFVRVSLRYRSWPIG